MLPLVSSNENWSAESIAACSPVPAHGRLRRHIIRAREDPSRLGRVVVHSQPELLGRES
jgi:hypothetical protein